MPTSAVVDLLKQLREQTLLDAQDGKIAQHWLLWLLLHGYAVADEDVEAVGIQAKSINNVNQRLRAAGFTVTRLSGRWTITVYPAWFLPTVNTHPTKLPDPPRAIIEKGAKVSTVSPAATGSARPMKRRTATAKTSTSTRETRPHPRLGESLTCRMLIAVGDDDIVIELLASDGRSFLAQLDSGVK